MKKVAIYLRTSTEEQNPENQKNDCIELAKKLGKEYDVLEEQASGWKDNSERPVFQEIVRRIQKGEVKELIVWDFDRLFRNRVKTVEFIRSYGKLGLRVHSVRQKWLEDLNKIPSPWNEIMFDLMLQIVAWMGEEESKKKSERVKAAVRKRGDKTYSYKGKKWGKPKLPLSVEKKILELHEQGKNYREIAREVYYWDASKHKKYVSLGFVHKTIAKFSAKNSRK